MNLMTPDEYDALTRTDFTVFAERVFAELNPTTPYADNFHIHIIAAKLEAVRRGEIKRLIINVPPRSLKSILGSVAFPAFMLGHTPSLKFIAASYGQDLSNALARDCRQVMTSHWYKRVFPGAALSADRLAVHAFETTTGGGRIATSVGGVVTGFGADIVVVDDPTKPDQALSDVERDKANNWYNHTLVSRLDNKVDGAIVVLMQRLHEGDFVGHIMSLEDWEVVSFPAIAQQDERHLVVTPHGSYVHKRAEGEALHPAREPLEVLERIRRTMGTSFFSAQYLQLPMPPGGGMIKEAWFQRYDPAHAPTFERIVQSWDCANKVGELNDYSVCTTWGVKDRHPYLINVLRKKLEYPDLKRAIVEQARLHRANAVLIEDRASGTQLIQDLRRDGMSELVAYEPKGDKIMRMHSQTATIEAQMVHLPIGAHWLEDYLHELMVFPRGRHDDQVDSTSQALDYLANGDDFAAWLQFMRERDGPRNHDEVPSIRVRHPNGGMALQAFGGRSPPREPDGSFLLTKSEWIPSLIGAGFFRVDEPIAA